MPKVSSPSVKCTTAGDGAMGEPQRVECRAECRGHVVGKGQGPTAHQLGAIGECYKFPAGCPILYYRLGIHLILYYS